MSIDGTDGRTDGHPIVTLTLQCMYAGSISKLYLAYSIKAEQKKLIGL